MGEKTVKVVLDANVYVSFFLTHSETIVALFSLWKTGLFTMYVSSAMIAEIYRVFRYPKIQKRITEEDQLALSELVEDHTERVFIKRNVRFPQDPDDAIYLETAQSCGAQFLVTGDKHLLPLKKFGATRIVSPKEFVEILRKVI